MGPDKPKRQPGFAILSKGMVRIWPHLKDSHRKVLPAFLCEMGYGSGTPGQQEVADKCGFTRRYVNKLAGELHRLGIFEKQRRPSAKSAEEQTCKYILADFDDDAVADAIIERCKRPIDRLPDRPVLHAFGVDLTEYGVGFSEDVGELPDYEEDEEDEKDESSKGRLYRESIRRQFSSPENTVFPSPENSPVLNPYELACSHTKKNSISRKEVEDTRAASPAVESLGSISSAYEAGSQTSVRADVCPSSNQPTQPSGRQPSVTQASFTQQPAQQALVHQPSTTPDVRDSRASVAQTFVGTFPDFPAGLPGQPECHQAYLPVNLGQAANGSQPSGPAASTQAPACVLPIEERRRLWNQQPLEIPF